MKTSRQLVLVLGALCGAASVLWGAPGVIKTISVGSRPSSYQKVSAMQVYDTMKGRKRIIDWTCYVDFGGGNTPASRTSGWLEGDFKSKADGVDLWDIGAQHRTHQLLVRLVPSGSHKAALTQVTDALGQPVNQAPLQDANGFYLVEGSLPNGGTNLVNSYVISTDDPNLHLDVVYVGHIPGGVVTRQIEDGGPPSIPPVNEN